MTTTRTPSLSQYPELEMVLRTLRSAAAKRAAADKAKGLWYSRSVSLAEGGNSVTAAGLWKMASPGGQRSITKLDRTGFVRAYPIEAKRCARFKDRIQVMGQVLVALPERLAVCSAVGLAQSSKNYYELLQMVKSADDTAEREKDRLRALMTVDFQDRLVYDGAVSGAWVAFDGGWKFQLGRDEFSREVAWAEYPEQTRPFTATEVVVVKPTWRFILPEDENDTEGVCM